MAMLAYLWLKDDGGADIKGAVDVAGREHSIEIFDFIRPVIRESVRAALPYP